jgi:DNA-directed RNA polymerase beta subunit
VINEGFFPIITVPFKSPTKENLLKAMTFLGIKPRYPVYLPEYKKTTDPIAIGYVYMHKLEHLSEKKIASRATGPYVAKTFSPTGGKKSQGGRKIGEGDLYSLLAWDVPIVIEEEFGPMSSDQVTKNEMISEIIQTGKTSFRDKRSNPEREFLGQMMLAIHLESE